MQMAHSERGYHPLFFGLVSVDYEFVLDLRSVPRAGVLRLSFCYCGLFLKLVLYGHFLKPDLDFQMGSLKEINGVYLSLSL